MQKWIQYIKDCHHSLCDFSRLVLRVCGQIAYCWWLLGCILWITAPLSADYFLTVACRQAAFDNISATLFAGIAVTFVAEMIASQNKQ